MILVVGYGNPLRGDDGLGQQVAARLAGYRADVETVACYQLLPELVEPVSRAYRVVFIDADAQTLPGVVTWKPVTQQADPTAFTHTVTPASLLAGAQALYHAEPQAVLITVGGADFGFGEQLSPPVAAALPPLLEALRAWIGAEDEKPMNATAIR